MELVHFVLAFQFLFTQFPFFFPPTPTLSLSLSLLSVFPFHFIYLAYKGKDIVFRFIIEYSSLRDFGP